MKVQVITPTSILCSYDSLSMMVVPALEGEMGLLPGHTSIISILIDGKIKLYQNDEVVYEHEIKSGVMQFANDTGVILISA
jgi:F-type H+-transporting ATPase subunit epsilon